MVKRDVATKQNSESAFEIAHCGEDNVMGREGGGSEEEKKWEKWEGERRSEESKEEELVQIAYSFVSLCLYCTLYHIYDKAVCLSHFSR